MDILSGIRVVDFTRYLAGPAATLLPALMGAEVIKVESQKSLDIFREEFPMVGSKVGMDSGLNAFNINKISITLDLTDPKGVEIAKKLVGISDIVVDNFRAGVMDSLGLGYDSLRDVKPDIVMLSISSHGATGPERTYGGWAATFGPLSGISHLTGYSDGPPSLVRSRADLMVGYTGTFALLAALIHRHHTGEGQFIDLSAREALTCSIGETLMDYFMNDRIPTRDGNRDDIMAPHNCFRCLGEDKWISIAVATQEEWCALCSAMKKPELIDDPRFVDVCLRWQNQDEMDVIIQNWTRNHTHYEVMHMLQEVGVAAALSFSNEELWKDPHTNQRGLFAEVTYPESESVLGVMGIPCSLSDTPPPTISPAPLMGQHNDYVLGQLLGMSSEEIGKLKEQGILR